MASFVIFSLPYVHYMEPPFAVVSPADLPDDFPLAIVTTDRQGVTHCRAIWARQLTGVLQRYPQSSLIISAKAKALCQQEVNHFEKQAFWSLKLPRERKSYWPYAAIKAEPEDGWIEVSYTSDDDLHNVARYKLQGERIVEAEQQRYSGPGLALRVIPYSVGTTLLFWLLLKLSLRWYRRKKEIAQENSSDSSHYW